MTTLLLEDLTVSRTSIDAVAPARRALTLEALVTQAFAGLQLRGSAACPSCGGQMRTVNAAGGAGPIGHCAACGSELS